MKIVCLGDSITCNWYNKSYTDFWQGLINQAKLNHKIINAGIPGETAQDGYYRLRHEVIPLKPDLVTIMFGHNDVYDQVPADTFSHYMQKIIDLLNNHSITKVWLLTPNKVLEKKRHKQYSSFLEGITYAAESRNAVLIDIWKAHGDTLPKSYYTDGYQNYYRPPSTDGVHPGLKGHQLIAQTLMDHLT